MEWKARVNLTINQETVKRAKEKRINLSEAAERGIAIATGEAIEFDTKEYPLEMAKLDSVTYWINPQGKCLKRNIPQYFMNDEGHTVETSENNYLKWLKFLIKQKGGKK